MLHKHGIDTLTFRQANLTNDEIRQAMEADEIKLLTVHSSKGLEADNVILVGNFYIKPESWMIRSYEEKVRNGDKPKFNLWEEQRIFYVGVTRARHNLYIMKKFRIGKRFIELQTARKCYGKRKKGITEMLTIKQKRDALEQQWKYGQISTYEYEMGDLDLRFCSPELRETDEYKLNKLKIQREWMVISESEYEIQTFDIVNKNKTPRERELAALDVRLKHNEIDQATYEVDKAQLEGRALGMVRLIYDENEDPENGYFDVRFNKLFVNKLREKGFQGEMIIRL